MVQWLRLHADASNAGGTGFNPWLGDPMHCLMQPKEKKKTKQNYVFLKLGKCPSSCLIHFLTPQMWVRSVGFKPDVHQNYFFGGDVKIHNTGLCSAESDSDIGRTEAPGTA